MDIIDYSTSPFWQFLNTQFVSSLIGALAGAFAGALAAHQIAEKAKDREYLQAQIRAINAAIMTSSVICMGMLASKKQIVKDIYQLHEKSKKEYLHAIKN